MRPATVFLAGSLLALVLGLSFLAAPGAVLPLYGVSPEAPTALLARFFGVALLHAGLLVYLLRDTRDAAVQRALALAGVVGSAAGVIVGLMGVLAGAVNALGCRQWPSMRCCCWAMPPACARETRCRQHDHGLDRSGRANVH